MTKFETNLRKVKKSDTQKQKILPVIAWSLLVLISTLIIADELYLIEILATHKDVKVYLAEHYPERDFSVNYYGFSGDYHSWKITDRNDENVAFLIEAIQGNGVFFDYNSYYINDPDMTHTIPADLDAAYKELDRQLSLANIWEIKNATPDDFIFMHTGLGMWIRNKWLRPEGSPLLESLDARSMWLHLDDISDFILKGYHHYLNGYEYSLQDYQEKQELQKSARPNRIARILSFVVVCGLTVALSLFGFKKLSRKKPSLTRFLERIVKNQVFRVIFVLWASALLTHAAQWLLFGNIAYPIAIYIYAAILSLIFVSAAFCLHDKGVET